MKLKLLLVVKFQDENVVTLKRLINPTQTSQFNFFFFLTKIPELKSQSEMKATSANSQEQDQSSLEAFEFDQSLNPNECFDSFYDETGLNELPRNSSREPKDKMILNFSELVVSLAQLVEVTSARYTYTIKLIHNQVLHL